MVTLSSKDGRSIQLSFTDGMNVSLDNNKQEIYYEIELPKVVCTSRKDAESIQARVKTFINDLSKELLK